MLGEFLRGFVGGAAGELGKELGKTIVKEIRHASTGGIDLDSDDLYSPLPEEATSRGYCVSGTYNSKTGEFTNVTSKHY